MKTTPIKQKDDIEQIKYYFLKNQNIRDYALFVVGINTAFRTSDLLQLRWEQVYDFKKNTFYKHIYIQEQKTQKKTCIAINEKCKNALLLLKEKRQNINSDEYIFYSGKNYYAHISRNRAYCIIKKAGKIVNIDGNISCHSMRKTFGYHA